MAQPLVALVGGDEFRPRTTTSTSTCSSGSERDVPRVAILPTAAREMRPALPRSTASATSRRLGAEAIAVMAVDKPSANDERLVAELDGVDLVYLAGGDPLYLLETLRDSLLWQRLSAPLSTRDAPLPAPAPARWCWARRWATEGSGRRRSACCRASAPCRTSRNGAQDALPRLEKRSVERGLTLLGIDGATGCVGWGGDWEVGGPGAVTVIRAGRVGGLPQRRRDIDPRRAARGS